MSPVSTAFAASSPTVATIGVDSLPGKQDSCRNRSFRARRTPMCAVRRKRPVETLVVAVPESAGSALYGVVDVLMAAGNLWQTLVRSEPAMQPFRVRIVSPLTRRFLCGNGIPVDPAVTVRDDPRADVIVLPELWLGPDEHLAGRYPALLAWIRASYLAGACIYSACS